MTHRIITLLVLSLGTFARSAEFPTPANNQPETIPLTPPEKIIGMMHLPPGFKATLFAHEPDVQQPIAMCWDERGRLWVAENYTYSDGKERFDLKLKDRILIFEDTKNTGHFDKRTVFHDDLQMLTSIERGFGGVYALCPPHLLWIPTDGDKPSGPPQIVLDGFSTTASSRHTFANGLKWGPDGWLYGRVGITSTSFIDVPGTPQEKRKPTAGGVWRYHPTRKIFEPYCHGTTNPWGMDWDEHGEMFFINTVIGHLWHGIQGAHFKRMHGEDPYEHIYGLIDQHADHYHWDTGEQWSDVRKIGVSEASSSKGGGHAHVGMMIYQGTNFPNEYRGKLFTTNLHGHRVNVDRLEREGSGFVGMHEPDFMKSDDPWLRATEIQYGPDGGVYILDWSDIGECHEADGVHRTSGRIYKITYGDPVKPKETDVTKLSNDELVKMQFNDNEWLVRMARWELRERKFRGELDMKKLTLELGGKMPSTDREHEDAKRLRMLWLGAFVGVDALDNFAFGLDERPRQEGGEYLNAWRTRFYVNDASADKLEQQYSEVNALNALGSSAATAAPAFSRLTWASLLPKLPANARFVAASGLLSHAEDATDHNLPLMIWFGIRDLPPAELVKLVKGCRIPIVTQFIARRIAEDIDKDSASLNTLLGLANESKSDGLPAAILTGMTDALKGWRKAKKPAAWNAFADVAQRSITDSRKKLEATVGAESIPSDALTVMLRDLNVLFGDGRALDEVRAIALDDKADVEARKSALMTLIEAKIPDLRKVCEKLLNEHSLSITAIRGLATFDDPAIAEMIVKRWRSFYANDRSAVIATLVSRPSFARVLLKNLGGELIARGDITPAQARQIRSFNDETLTKQLEEKWGAAHESRDDIKKLVASLKVKLTPDFIAKGNPSQGRALFAGVCATCHKLYGEGAAIGPDLTGSGRHDVNYLIENIADPSAVVAADFTMVIVTLKDGRVLNGIVSAKTDRTITLKMIGQEATVDRSDITKQEQLPISMMPEGLLTALSDKQLADLVSYLMTNGQVPLPSTDSKAR